MVVSFWFLLLVILMIGGIHGYKTDKRLWNNGVCKQSGLPWKQMGTSDHNGRTYHDGEGNMITITWNVDR